MRVRERERERVANEWIREKVGEGVCFLLRAYANSR